jgi:hypothetical protein
MEIEPNVVIYGSVTEVDASFDHAFGRQKAADLEVEKFSVSAFIEGNGYDVTALLLTPDLAKLKEKFRLFAVGQLAREGVPA